MGSYGFKLSKAGHDVLTAGEPDMLLTSTKRMVHIYFTGTGLLTVTAADNIGHLDVTAPYYAAGEPIVSTYIPAGIGTAVINGKRYRTNMASLFSNVVGSPNDEHFWQARLTISSPDNIANVRFTIGRTSGSSKWNLEEVFSIRYFIIGAI